MNLLLALADKPSIDVSAHLEIATNLALTGVVLMIAFFAVRYDLWRRLWFDRVDPRPAACMRIFFGLVIVITFTDLLKPSGPLEISVARFLFTDDGLWLTDMARKNYGGDLKELWDPEHGVQGVGAWFSIIYNKFCIFHMRSDPPFVFLLYGLMLASLVGMIVGWKTRAMTIIAWILVENFYRYSPIFYTGGDTVVRIFLFMGMFTRWGEAYSLDSWRRRRKAILGVSKVVPPLRKIPAWPMRIMALQLCIIYCATGILKSGSTWMNGTALYYALNLDHFYRVPQQRPVIFFHWLGVLPFMVRFVRWWEVLFPLAAIGMALNTFEREKAAGVWPKAVLWRRLTGYALFAAAFAMGAYIAGLAAYYYLPKTVLPQIPVESRIPLVAGLTAAVPIVSVTLYLLGRKYLPAFTRFIRHWFLGKRFWLGFGFLMHIGIDVGMNVGTFAEVMMAVYLAWLSGPEIESFWRVVYSKPARPGEHGRPPRPEPLSKGRLRVLRNLGRRFIVPIIHRLKYRKPGKPIVVLHAPDEASVRRAALLRVFDLGHRLSFEVNEHVPSQALRVRNGERVFSGDRAAAELSVVLPLFIWMRVIRALPPLGKIARVVLRQRA